MNYTAAIEKSEQIFKDARWVNGYDWEEIFEYVPGSEEIKTDILNRLKSIEENAEELKKFFR